MGQRNYYLDFLRGIAAINIIIIHTAFWSGGNYVPTCIQNLTLMLDVPFFFFLAGWSFAYVKSCKNIIKGLAKIQKQYLFFLVLYSGVLFIFAREEVSWNNFVLNFFYMNKIISNTLPVVMGSIWFMPVFFSVSLIFPFILLAINKKEDNYLYFFLIIICVCGVLYNQLGGNFFNISINILFYGIFYIIGFISKNYRITSAKGLSIYILTIIGLVFVCKKVLLIDELVIQNLKFPPNIIYLLLSLISIGIALYLKNRVTISKDNLISKMGNHAIFYYFGQGISSSLMKYFVTRVNFAWPVKFLIIVVFNILLTIIISEFIYKLYLLTENELSSKISRIKTRIPKLLEYYK